MSQPQHVLPSADFSKCRNSESASPQPGRVTPVPAYLGYGGISGRLGSVFTTALAGLDTGMNWLERHAPEAQSRWGKALRGVCLVAAAVG